MIKGASNAKAWEKAEDPIYVLDNNIPLDTEWYLEHQLSEPIKRLFEPIMPDNVNSLLQGDHTRKIKKAMPTTGGLMKFVAVTRRCLGCKAQMAGGSKDDDGGLALCGACKPREADIYLQKVQKLAEAEKAFWQTFVMCQRISGDLHKDAVGIARDSPIYYQMKKAQKDLKEAKETVGRFGEMGVGA